jgi:isocitrate/isopropylmalate dehydrogenase
MLLRYSLKLDAEASQVENAVDAAILSGKWTVDLGGSLTTAQMTEAIISNLI